MGSRALFQVDDGRACGYYWLHWGSPVYQIPNLATFIRYCRTRALAPMVGAFDSFAHLFTAGQLPTEPVPAAWWDQDNTDAENRYHLATGAAGGPVRLLAEIRHLAPSPTPGHGRWRTVCQSTGDAQLYLAAARARDRMAADIRRLAARNPGLVGTRWLPLPEVRAVLADAARFRRWAAAAEHAQDAAASPAAAGGTRRPDRAAGRPAAVRP
jgi:hypothetical protein